MNILPLSPNERITAILPLTDLDKAKYIFMATKHGTVKKVAITEFSRPRSTGLIALDLNENDELVGVQLTDGTKDILLFSLNQQLLLEID